MTYVTGDERYNNAVRFWAKVFGINFAVGVVTGIPMEFQFRTNWAGFTRYAGFLATAAAAIFPIMLYSTIAPQNSLTAYDLASSHRALVLASVWWPLGFVLATTYFVFTSRHYAVKVSVERDNQGFY